MLKNKEVYTKMNQGVSKKTAIAIIFTIVVFIIFLSASSEDSEQINQESQSEVTKPLENKEVVTEVESQESLQDEKGEVTKDAVWIVSIKGSLLPKITSANEMFTQASYAGAELDIVTAENGYRKSLEAYKESQEILSQIEKPEDTTLLNADTKLRLSLEKQTLGVETALLGLQSFDTNTIEAAAAIYAEGSVHMGEVAKLMTTYTESQ